MSKHYIKFSISDSKLIESYVKTKVESLGDMCNMVIDNNSITVYFNSVRMMKSVVESVANDYAELYTNVPEHFPYYEMIVFCTDPEYNNHLVQTRFNIIETEIVAMVDQLSEAFSEIDQVENRVELNETLNIYSGVFKFKEIINALLLKLEEGGIHATDEVNEAAKTTIH